MVYMLILRGGWCHIIFLNAHASKEDEVDGVKDSSNEELERVYDSFHNNYMKFC
jgi:hypothetical protein